MEARYWRQSHWCSMLACPQPCPQLQHAGPQPRPSPALGVRLQRCQHASRARQPSSMAGLSSAARDMKRGGAPPLTPRATTPNAYRPLAYPTACLAHVTAAAAAAPIPACRCSCPRLLSSDPAPTRPDEAPSPRPRKACSRSTALQEPPLRTVLPLPAASLRRPGRGLRLRSQRSLPTPAASQSGSNPNPNPNPNPHPNPGSNPYPNPHSDPDPNPNPNPSPNQA